MDLCAIDGSNVTDAVRLLCEGFPRQSSEFWQSGLERAAGLAPERAGWPPGYLLKSRGEPVGVMLTFAGRRRLDADDQRVIVNLSSWYVAPSHRAMTALMLVRLLRDTSAVYTDLTAAPALFVMLERLGFKKWTDGRVLFLWPFPLRGAHRRGRVVSVHDAPAGVLDESERRLLSDHEALGCIAAVLEYESRWMPLLFRKTTVKGMAAGHVIYAPNRRTVLDHAAAVGRFLMARGIPLLTVDARETEERRGGLYRSGRVRWYRGRFDGDRIDYAYSELVYLDLGTD